MLKEHVELIEVDTAGTTGSVDTVIVNSEHVHKDIVVDISRSIIEFDLKEAIVDGPQGSGRTSLVAEIEQVLINYNYNCLMIDLSSARSQYLMTELQHFIQLQNLTNKKAVFFDNCIRENVQTLMDQVGDEKSILDSMRIAGIVIVYIPDADISEDLKDVKNFDIPPISVSQAEQLLENSFNFHSVQRQVILDAFKTCPQYPLHLMLVATLYLSSKYSQLELINTLPQSTESNQFLDEIFCAIFKARDNADELYVLAGVQLFHNIDGASPRDLFQTLQSHRYSEDQLIGFLNDLISCRLLPKHSNGKYFLCSKQLINLSSFEQFADISRKVLLSFLRLNLYAVIRIVNELNDEEMALELWKIKKPLFLKVLTYDFEITTEFAPIVNLRFDAMMQLRKLWQCQFITFIEALNVYERFMHWSMRKGISQLTRPQLESLRVILTHYISLFFYFRKAVDFLDDVLGPIFGYVDKVIGRLGTPTDELYCELLSYIIEIKIHHGETEEAHKNLKQVLAIQEKLPSWVSDGLVEKIKIRLDQLETLRPSLHESGDTLDCTASSPIYSKMMNAKIRIGAGDKAYIKHDFAGANRNYSFAMISLEQNNGNQDRMWLEARKDVQCRIGKIKLQSPRWVEKCLEDFKKCQEFYTQLEIGRVNTEYNVYIATAFLLMGENSRAMPEVLNFWKTGNKSMFIAVTDVDAQRSISRNLKERLTGPEINHLDNYMYEGKVNFLYLKSTNYHWVKMQLTDEIIDVHPNANEREIRASTLQFPNHGNTNSNKRLVVAFLASERGPRGHLRVNSETTVFSDISHIDRGLSEVRSDFITDDVMRGAIDHSDSIVKSVYRTAFSVVTGVAMFSTHGLVQELYLQAGFPISGTT
eukprot:sb/3461962/